MRGGAHTRWNAKARRGPTCVCGCVAFGQGIVILARGLGYGSTGWSANNGAMREEYDPTKNSRFPEDTEPAESRVSSRILERGTFSRACKGKLIYIHGEKS